MLKKIAVVLVLVVGAFLGFVATRPTDYVVERTGQMSAPPAAVFPLVNDFHKWPQWSPWEKLDPALKRTFSGAEAGQGAGYAWVGNKDVGEGRMTIVESKPDEQILIKLEFLKPFEATCKTTFTFQPEAGGTRVTWRMEGQNNFIAKAFSVFVNMDKMVGGDFEKGLAAMKTASERT